MKANYRAFRIAGMLLLFLAPIAQGEEGLSTFTCDDPYANRRDYGADTGGSALLLSYREIAGPTKHAIPAVDKDPRYAAAGSSTNGLVGWWKLDETEGTSASDSSGNGHTGTLLNGPVWTTGQVRGALSFDGTNDQVTCVESPALRISGDLTIAFWTKKSAEAKQVCRLVGKGNISERNYGFWEEASSGGRLLFQQIDFAGRGVNLLTASKLTVGTWYHVAAVVRGSNVSVYVNGKLDASGRRNNPAPMSKDPLTFGYSGWNDHFPGVLDDVRIYNRALTSEEIAELHSEALPDRRRAGRNLQPPPRPQIAKAQARRIEWPLPRHGSF